ncbi:MAG: DUF1080 domain-containing protein [Rubripirellula sp.]|nr:DUF1080 domain-containing protein [Rubripirellula sp.]
MMFLRFFTTPLAWLITFSFLADLPSVAGAQPEGIDSLISERSPLSEKEVIAFFGDSITQAGARPGGYCKLIGEAIASEKPELGVEIVYAGISGNKVPDLEKRLERDLLSKKPTLVFIYIGINDVWHSTRGNGTPKVQFDAGLRRLVKKISESGARVVLCTPSVIGEKKEGANSLDEMLDEYSAISRKVAVETGVTLCDLRKSFIDHLKSNNPANKPNGILTKDGVHLNIDGNRFVAALASEAIAETLRKSGATTGSAKNLFNGKDLTGWHVDVPHRDNHPDAEPTFVVRDGMLVSLGNPQGHLITDKEYENFRLEVEYRFAAKPGNCGVLVNASDPRALYKMFPKSIEVQMNHTHAGDFWCIVEDITVPDMVKRRGPREKWGITEGKARRILNLTDGSEKPVGDWNRLDIECLGDQIKVWVNGDLVNHGTGCTASKGQIALQAEGSEVEFRKLELSEITTLSD